VQGTRMLRWEWIYEKSKLETIRHEELSSVASVSSTACSIILNPLSPPFLSILLLELFLEALPQSFILNIGLDDRSRRPSYSDLYEAIGQQVYIVQTLYRPPLKIYRCAS
jgi:hypothetical protein